MPTANQIILARPFGFLTDQDLPALIKEERLCPLLVRCDRARFVAAAQDVPGLVKALESAGWYIRDVSATSERLDRARIEEARNARQKHQTVVLSDSVLFNEADCGGAFDGRQVTSDADPGL